MHTIGQNPPDATPAGDGGDDGGDGAAAGVAKPKGKAKKAAKTGGEAAADKNADAAENGDKPKGDNKAGGLDLQALLDEARKSLGGDAESSLS